MSIQRLSVFQAAFERLNETKCLRTCLITLIAPPSIAPLMRARLGARRGDLLKRSLQMETNKPKAKVSPSRTKTLCQAEGMMKDQLITVLEALRLAKAEFRTHDTRRVKNSPRTLLRLREILFDDRLTQALRSLGQDDESPSVVPPQDGGSRSERV
jgi:hypothetical protein